MMISYCYSADGITPDKLQGFFEGWSAPPSPETHLRLLAASDEIVLALDNSTGAVIGFITAITDHVLAAYISLLEVLPQYRGGGVGSELVRRMLSQLEGYYIVDVMCDKQLQPFYSRFGMKPATGVMRRNYQWQMDSKEK